MKYLRKFNTEADVMMFDLPNVVLVADTESVMFNVEPPKGAFIQHIDGKLYTTDQWTANGFANDQANGVAVIGDNAKFVIAKVSFESRTWSSDTSNAVEGVMLTNNNDTAKTDYAGAANTALIAVDDTSGAALACANFTFPNGAKGYLPALGEWNEAYSYKADIDTAMVLIGGTALTGGQWSSTQLNATFAWYQNWTNGKIAYTQKNGSQYARPFTALNI